jgi:hypothetical protein
LQETCVDVITDVLGGTITGWAGNRNVAGGNVAAKGTFGADNGGDNVLVSTTGSASEIGKLDVGEFNLARVFGTQGYICLA